MRSVLFQLGDYRLDGRILSKKKKYWKPRFKW